MNQTFYKFHLPALSYGQCWHAAKNPFDFLCTVVFKTARISFTPLVASACPERIIRVAPGSINPELTQLLKPRLEQARAFGIEDGIWYTLPAIGAASIVASVFRLPDGSGAFVLAAAHITQNGITIDKGCKVSFVTQLSSGRIILTAPEKPDMSPPLHYECEYLPRAPLSMALDRHRDRLSMADERPVLLNSEDDMEDFSLRNEKAIFDVNIERGIFVPVTAAEEATLRAATHATPSDAPAKSTKGIMDILSWFSIAFGFIQLLNDNPNDAQLIFRWSLIGGGIVGLVILATVRHFRRTE
ncbi:MAG: hypothetical protein ACI8P0_004023 [Planctomycetaceae bacterium]|jgi:hypothetical protein